jgi:hypothetical protein
MAIYTPAEIGQLKPKTIPEAAAKGAINVLCTGAPYLAGYGVLTGNLPAIAYGAGMDIACNLPLIPLENPPLPPLYLPQDGGCLPILYRVRALVTTSSPDCQESRTVYNYTNLRGPISRAVRPWGRRAFTCKRGTQLEGFSAFIVHAAGEIGVGVFFPDMGDVFSLEVTPMSGTNNDSSCLTPTKTPLPPGALPPPGYPDNPQIPGGERREPIYGPNPTEPPKFWLPITVPPIILPIVKGPLVSVPINAPITIPVNIPISVSPTVNVTIPIQIGPNGNIHTPPDLLPQYEPPLECPECPPVPTLTGVSLPFVTDSGGGSCTTVFRNLLVLPSSIPSDLSKVAFDSAVLAEEGCRADSSEPAVLAVPEWWPQRTGQRPQLSFVFRYPTSNSFGVSSLVVPYPKQVSRPPANFDLDFSYFTGSYLGMTRFSDGSRLQVYASSEGEAYRVLGWLESQMEIPAGIEVIERYAKFTTRAIAENEKFLIKLVYFPEGRASLSPAWEWQRSLG